MTRALAILSLLIIGCAASSKWQFEDPPTLMVVTQRLVIEKKHPVLFVVHDKSGDWQFLANEFSRLDPVVELPLSDLLTIDSTLGQVAHLERGRRARRTALDSTWSIAPYK